ncbi:MAG: glycoside hydrolase family 127 protein [Abitibacteriaceae bacterium]|nr:glycoside hydrolase family 127 protein [Abditibacteriaceae bacterium]MBV9865118.1 glycoside hydrolase family 127 protein [Abditibacteriaceae bacterium]
MTAAKAPASLRPLAFEPLPLGSIRPAGWLHNQLRIQANGLTGHLDEFWPDIKDSAWIGGKAEGWERGPYWLDGAIPLAYELQDEKLKAKVKHWVDYILAHQQPDGWLAPVQQDKNRMYDPWPTFVLFKAFIQYYEATSDPRIIPAMSKCMTRMNTLLDEKPLSSWGKSRWADLVWCVHWLYERTGDHSLLDFAAKAHQQGEDWGKLFTQFPYRDRVTEHFDQTSHGVNNGMAIKASGVWFRQSSDAKDRAAVFAALKNLDTYHGQASGVFSCDEHLAGRNPSQGTELCTVVEEMFSLEVLTSVLGEAELADRLERITYNALPATFKPDMTAHQYDQQSNQVVCKVSPEHVYATNNQDSNLYGLEPNFGCCTANMHQGWPKFTSHLWMRSPDHGLAAVAYAPCVVNTQVNGKPVQVQVETEYPFSETIKLTVTAQDAMSFPLYLRIPAWANGAQLQVGKGKAVVAKPGTFQRVEHKWHGSTVITLHLPMQPRVERGYHNSVIVERGPLVYSLKIGQDWKHLRRELPFADWEVHPTTPWNYALQIDPQHPAKSLQFGTKPIGDVPFSAEGAPVQAVVKGRRIPAWTLEKNAAAPPPQSPVQTTEPVEELTLIPYGCANLRVTEFPSLD